MLKKKRLFWFTVFALFVWSVLIEPRWVAQRKEPVHFPAGKPLGLRVVLTSDWHLTQRPLWRVMSRNRALQIVQDINAKKPDIVLIAGDLIAEESQTPELGASVEEDIAIVLSKLKATRGVYAVLGNHDNWYDHEKMKARKYQIRHYGWQA